MILKNLIVGMYGTNCYIVGSDQTKEGMIIDPGDEPEEIIKAVNNLKLTIKLIVITHGHPDHTGALEDVMQRTGAKLASRGI